MSYAREMRRNAAWTALTLMGLAGWLPSCSSTKTADNCQTLQEKCLDSGKCLTSHNKGSTSGSAHQGSDTGGSVDDSAECDFSCASCESLTSGGAGANGATGGAPGAGGEAGQGHAVGGAPGTGAAGSSGGAPTPDELAQLDKCSAASSKAACMNCLWQLLASGAQSAPLTQLGPCLCGAGVCDQVCATSACQKPLPVSWGSGDPCGTCLVQALTGQCKQSWDAFCASNSMLTAGSNYCGWPVDGTKHCGL